MNSELLLILSNVLTGIAGWFVGRKRQQAETDNQVLKNLELSINLYKQVIDDLKVEIGALKRRIQELEEKINELHNENKKLKAKL
jgi:peptidoglycan hydrolase CwlO-like protein